MYVYEKHHHFISVAGGGRGQPKPAKLKRVSKLSKQDVCGCACGGHATALITREGKLYMFGSLEEDLVDKSSGEWPKAPQSGCPTPFVDQIPCIICIWVMEWFDVVKILAYLS